MFTKTWETSRRKYNVITERNVRIPMRDEVEVSADIFRPDSDEKYPALLGTHPYDQISQTAPIKPEGHSSLAIFPPAGEGKARGNLEAGDPNFFVRRGYVQVVVNVRGTGLSDGYYNFLGTQEAQDGYDIIEWMAQQPWCDGNVSMFGPSYFAMSQFRIAATQPPHLKCIFAPWAGTNLYRDFIFHGGILTCNFPKNWITSLSNLRYKSYSKEKLGEEGYKKAIEKAVADKNLLASGFADILRNPDNGNNPLIVDLIINPLWGPFWEERCTKFENINVPAYIGADWGLYGIHLPGAFRNWKNLNVPKKMIIGSPTYLDRPLYQIQFESLRWFDYHLKGIDTGIMNEAPIRMFIPGTGDWKETTEWPLPETLWTPFYLHEENLLSEHEHWPNEGHDSFEDSPWKRGYLEYYSPQLVENMEVIGPIVLNLFASTTDTDIFWIISLREVDKEGNERELTKGWLKGSHREIDEEKSLRWQPHHPHAKEDLLEPNRIYEFNIPIIPTGNFFKTGSRIAIKISCADDPPKHSLEALGGGHILRQSPSRIAVYHNADYPSQVLLPITRGNILGTFVSGGRPFVNM